MPARWSSGTGRCAAGLPACLLSAALETRTTTPTIPKLARARIATVVAALALAVAVVFLLRGGDDPPPEKSATNQALSDAMALGSLEAEAELERRSQELQDKAGNAPAGSDRLDNSADRIDDLQWRAFNEQFRKTPFDRAIDELPLHKPPLAIEQWVTDSPPDKLASEAARERFYRTPARKRAAAVRRFYRSAPNKLYARVDLDRWYRMSERQREKAFEAFYRQAEKHSKKHGIRDLVLVIAPLTKTTERLPALAIGRAGSASLTPLGRNRPDSGI